MTPGAVVRVHSAAGLALEVVSDGSGTYRFASLPPGRYELTATLSGFVSARVVNIDLKLGVELRIDLALQTAGVTETVEVVGESPLVAITQSSRATSLREEQIEKMPRGRDFTSLVTQAAGVNAQRKSGYNVSHRRRRDLGRRLERGREPGRRRRSGDGRRLRRNTRAVRGD